MTKIFPFRAVTFDTRKVGDLSAVTTQPYDKIGPDKQREYYAKHPQNVVRIIKGRDLPEDTAELNKYTRAGEVMEKWLAENVLTRRDKPAIWAYYQEYAVEGKIFIRKGFTALTEALEPGSGVRAHEKTLAAPKMDRLNLMRTTHANFGHIFMLYDDPTQAIIGEMDHRIAGRKPDLVSLDDFGNRHSAWAIEDPEFHAFVAEIMAEKTLFIADGHHRFETAGNFRKEMEAKGRIGVDPESVRNVMISAINLNDPGLTVLPTHRLVHSLTGFEPAAYLKAAEAYFEVQRFPFTPETEKSVAADLFAAMDALQNVKVAFGICFRGYQEMALLTLRGKSVMDELVGGKHCPAWKALDVAVLHTILLDKLLGIDDAKLEQETNVTYAKNRQGAIDTVKRDAKFNMAFFLNPTRVIDVRDVADAGERMPQKSTDFYPKLLTGFINNVMRFE